MALHTAIVALAPSSCTSPAPQFTQYASWKADALMIKMSDAISSVVGENPF